MIESDVGFRQTIEVMSGMYRGLADLQQRVAPQNFKNYLMLAEGPLDEIRKARREIEAYLGITDFVPKFEQEMLAIEAEEAASKAEQTPVEAETAGS